MSRKLFNLVVALVIAIASTGGAVAVVEADGIGPRNRCQALLGREGQSPPSAERLCERYLVPDS